MPVQNSQFKFTRWILQGNNVLYRTASKVYTDRFQTRYLDTSEIQSLKTDTAAAVPESLYSQCEERHPACLDAPQTYKGVWSPLLRSVFQKGATYYKIK